MTSMITISRRRSMARSILRTTSRPNEETTCVSTDSSSCATPSAKIRWVGDALCIEASSARLELEATSLVPTKHCWELHTTRTIARTRRAFAGRSLCERFWPDNCHKLVIWLRLPFRINILNFYFTHFPIFLIRWEIFNWIEANIRIFFSLQYNTSRTTEAFPRYTWMDSSIGSTPARRRTFIGAAICDLNWNVVQRCGPIQLRHLWLRF